MTIDEYIKGLEKLYKDFPVIIDKVVAKNKGRMLGMIKLRWYQTGLDANGELIGMYRRETIEIKKGKGQRTAFVNLQDTHAFKDAMTLISKNNTLIVNSTDSKTHDILKKYSSKSLFAFSEDEINTIIDLYFDPEVQKRIDDLGLIEIPFSLK